MKKSVALYVLLCLTLSSCSWTIPHLTLTFGYPKGRTYTVWVPAKVPIYKEPILKSEPFYLATREDFTIEDLSCSDYRLSCNLDMYLTTVGSDFTGEAVMFYKIRFKSGGYAYIKAKDLHHSGENIVWPDDAVIMARLEPALYKNAGFDSVWNATLNSLEALDYVIEEMSKEEGYITTKMRTQKNKDKDKVSIRVSRVNDSAAVADISSFILRFHEVNKETGFGYWQKKDADGYLEQQIKETIASRLQAK